MIDGVASNVTEASSNQLKFITPETTTSGPVTAQVIVNSVENTFAYTTVSSASITSINPNKASTIARTTVTITGAGFTSFLEVNVKVFIGTIECSVASITSTEITCDVDGGPPGTYQIYVLFEEYGYASGSPSFVFEFEILSISPTNGSTKGGTILTITGAGFGLGEGFEDNVVSVGVYNAPCETIHQNYTTVICATGPLVAGETDTAVIVAVAMKNYYAECSIESSSPSGKKLLTGDTGDLIEAGKNCVFTYSTLATPAVNASVSIHGVYGDEVTINGESLGDSSEFMDIFLAANSTLCSETTCRDPTLLETEGFERCSIVESTETSVRFSVPNVEAGLYR